jgi:hypothetical protein
VEKTPLSQSQYPMSRILYRSHTLFRSLGLIKHINRPSNSVSYHLLQRCLTAQAYTQTAQDVVKPGAMNADQLYQRAKSLVEAKRHDIERSMLEIESKVTQAPSDAEQSDYIRFPKPDVCLRAEDNQSDMEAFLEKDIFLMSLVINVVKPEEVIKIQELVDRLMQNYEEVLGEHGLITKVTLKPRFFKWLHRPMIKQYIITNTPDMNNTASMKEKSNDERMKQVFDHTTVQWTGVTVEKIVERLAAEDYGLEAFPLEEKLYLPHVSVTAEEAKELEPSSEQLQKLDEEIINYYDVR